MATYLFILNKNKPSQQNKSIEIYIKKYFVNNRYRIEYSQSAKHLSTNIDSWSSDYDTIVVAGGDGTLNSILEYIVKSQKKLALIPLGTGNGFARHMKIPLKIKDSISGLLSYTPQKLDILHIVDTPHYALNVIGLGFDAAVADAFLNRKDRSLSGYAKCFLKVWKNYRESEIYVSLLGKEEIKRKPFLFSICNGEQYGFGVKINPTAINNDGQMELIFISNPKWYKLPIYFYCLYRGKIDKLKEYEILKTSSLVIKHNKLPFHLDGEIAKVDNEVQIALLSQKIEVYLPKKI